MPSQKNLGSVQRIKEQLQPGKAFYFTDFTGISVKNLEKLRRALREKGGKYLVLKNTLALLAMKNLGFENENIEKFFTGPTGVAIALKDPIAPAKILKETENLKIKGAVLEGAVFDDTDVLRFAKIPSKTVLLKELVGSLNLVGDFVGVLEEILRNLIRTIDAIRNKEVK
jgi:large subunit ribosomal protein L10